MSHNLLTVNDQGGDRLSAITVSVSQYVNEIRIGTNGSNTDAYSNSPATTLDNSTLYFYDSSLTNNITGASITSTNDWVESITLPAGRYFITAVFSVKFTASGRFAYQLHNGSGFVGSRAQIGDNLQFSTESAPASCFAVVDITNNATYTVKSVSSNTNLDSIANQGDLPSEESFIYIRKL